MAANLARNPPEITWLGARTYRMGTRHCLTIAMYMVAEVFLSPVTLGFSKENEIRKL